MLAALLCLSACSVMPPEDFPRMDSVDVDRYMGGWFVIAHIPPESVADSYNNIERYTRGEDNRILTDYSYREGRFDGERKRSQPTGFVIEGSHGAVWGMQFIWPLKLEYTIAYVDPDYQRTIVARSRLDWVWIMARTPSIAPAQYQELVARVAALGYDSALLRKVPQQPLSQREDVDFEIAQ